MTTRKNPSIHFLWLLIFGVALLTASCSSSDSKEGASESSPEISSREMNLPAPEKDECSEGKCDSGQGTFRWTTGDIYKGNFENGKRNGTGTYVWKSGAKYVGQWKDGMREGKGVYTYPNGDVYNGEFKADKRNGSGIYTYADGSVHPARKWENGKPVQ